MITYFHRHPRAGFSINKVSQTYIRNIAKKVSVKQYYVPCYRADPISCLRNILFVFSHRNKDGINHITGDIHYCILALINCKSILTIHDTCILHNTKNIYKKKIFLIFWFIIPLLIANKIVCISNNTKNEITKLTKKKDIEVIYNAIDPLLQPVIKEFGKEKPLIIQIGSGWNKNLINVISAISSIFCHLRIIGKLTYEQQECLEINNIDYSVTYDLTDEEIVKEYENCDLVCFCSIFEGFGMPPLEAQAVGRPVLTSNIEPITEIAGDGALFVNPHDVSEIRTGLLSIIQNDTIRKTIITYGFINVKRFNHKLIAEQYLQLYNNI